MPWYDPNDAQSVEKYSSAVTLSDMEVFIFPELMYSLVLANAMSPLMWQFREDSWFRKLPKMNTYRRVQRTKQFIMDNFVFNLDLDTWGLTTKRRELARFAAYIDEKILAQSNALFGYEGDKYYFDIDIRRHFGLDKYTSDIIPYWKTETVEAMHAFRYKESYPTGAGECVSLAALYATALHVIAGIPLSDIHMMATPLHSQNYVDVREGLLTNNRRIVTKAMWYNGTELSAKARRALENERITVVANNRGYVHTLYEQATMPPEVYRDFTRKLRNYLKTDINFYTLASFLRQNSALQNCFQIAHSCCGKPRYIEAEKAFHYEHSSKSRIGDETQVGLLHQIDEDEYYPEPLPNRILLDELENYFRDNPLSIDSPYNADKLKSYLRHTCYNVEEVVNDLLNFCRIEPRIPASNKHWVEHPPLEFDGLDSREAIVEYLESIRDTHPVADLAFTAFRDMNRAPWKPFLKAALERNPVSVEGSRDLDIDQAAHRLWALENESIYDGARMAQPDEVWNFGRGDGLEKAVCLLNIIRNLRPEDEAILEKRDGTVCVCIKGGKEYRFESRKELGLPEERDFPPRPQS
ncbi:MAG: hypothetical protein GF344_01795 [Chitinivibrionales bacterium]|nr:hypothetical protein [Chitinivibrionales bacterium]MBD3355826.1 hypothetical protein [Chitinivibrionales bacterium]